MQQHGSLPHLREVILFLALAGILIPLLQRLRVSPVLGFLVVGALVGPYGLAALAQHAPWVGYLTFPRAEGVAALSEFGVLFLMFTIGLELSAERLWRLRRWVFGAGAVQVAATALVVFALAHAFGNRGETAIVLGMALSLSSTAVVMQILTQRRELGTPLGQASFSVLLFQDLAVVPLLILVNILGTRGGAFLVLAGMAIAKAVVAMAIIYLLGRRLIRPLFHHLSRVDQPDTFMALTLFSTLGIAALTWWAGLSMALGAFLAGLLLAETEYRHEVDVVIEPFKGLLMGLFFMSVGMGIDVRAIANEPLWLPLSIVGLVAVKAAVVFLVFRGFGLSWGRALEAGLLLSQGGEFAFVVIGGALALQLMEPQIGQFMLLVVGASLFVAPPLAWLGRAAGSAWEARTRAVAQASAPVAPTGLAGHVVIAGFGRVGQLLGQILDAQNVPYAALEHDAERAAPAHGAGLPVFYGDASRSELLRRVRLEHASVAVLTMDHAAAALRTVTAIRRDCPQVRVLARARDEKHARALREAGADMVIPETLETGLQLAAAALGVLGMPETATGAVVTRERERRIAVFRGEDV